MKTAISSSLKRRSRLVAGIAGGLVSLIGASGGLGWIFGPDRLKSILAAGPAMAAGSALALVLAGAALMLLVTETAHSQSLPAESKRRPALSQVAQICAWLVALTGLLRLCDYLIGWNLGLDQLFFKAPRAR